MSIRIQDGWTSRLNIANGSPQFWGIASFSRQTANMRELLMAELRDRPDVEWIAGDNWCLVCEKREGSHNSNSLVSCNEGALHVAVAGKAWALNDEVKSDAQLVADLYQLHKDGVINHCDGQFAAAIIDEKNSRTILTVNWPGGHHWLYYCTDGHSLAFATRLDLLINRCGWKAQVSEQAMVDLLRFGGLLSEISLLEGVNRVIPGSVVVFEKGHAVQSLVYQYPLVYEDYEPPDTAKLARLHREAIQRRISGCDGFGFFLSGGLDSSLNVAVAAELNSKPVKTFSATFDVAEFDESSYARIVATKYNTEHFELRVNTADCLDRLPEMVWAMQEPIIDYSYIPTFYVAEAVKKHVDVAIGGDGPDQFLGEHYAYAAWYDLLSRIPFALSAAAWSVSVSKRKAYVRHGFWQYARRQHLGRKLWQSLACTGDPCGSGVLNSFCSRFWGDLPPNDLVRLLSPELLRRVSVPAYNREWIERWQMHQASNSQNNFILADASLAGLCGSFTKVGAMCSAHNLIIDEPYLDKPLFRYCYGLKDSWRVGGSWSKRLTRTIPTSETKRILRQVAMRYLPEELVLHKPKHGFGLPLIKCWQQYTSGVSARQIFGALLTNTDWLDHKYLDRLVQEQASGVRNHRYILLLLAALDQWFRIFVQGHAEPPTWRWSNCF